MNAQTICERIQAEAREEASAALKAAEQRCDALEKENDERVEAERVQVLVDAKREGEEERGNMLRMAQLEERKLDLAMKRDVLDELFGAVVKEMANMPDDKARAYLEGLIIEAAEGECRLVVREEDAHLYDEAFLRRVNGKLQNAHVTLSDQRRPLTGGFVLIKGGMEINCSYDAVVRELRAGLEADAARALFE